MQDPTSLLSGFLASISLPSIAVLAAACVVLALLRKDDLAQVFARIVIVFGTATAAVWLSWKLSPADWWTATKSVLAYGFCLITIVLGANGLARILSNEKYNSGQESTELLLEINPFAIIGGAIAALGLIAILFIDWLAVAVVLAVGWLAVVGALLLAQYLSMSILDASEETQQQRDHDRILQKAERKRRARMEGNRGPAPAKPLVPPNLPRNIAACMVALAFAFGASVLMLST